MEKRIFITNKIYSTDFKAISGKIYWPYQGLSTA